MLEMIQDKTTLIDPTIDIREEAGMGRSLRQGVDYHARNLQIDETLIKAINRWRSEINGQHRGALPMIDAYTKLDLLKPLYLRFPKAL